MDGAAVKSEIDRLGPWLHDIEVLPGLRTGAARPADDPDKDVPKSFDPGLMMKRLVDDIYGDLAGRSFLDCGCNAGGHTFAAAGMGAGRTLAFDARQHWLDQAAFLGRHFDAPQAEFKRLTLSDLEALAPEPFDITLFSGLFYHLPDPVAGLKAAADLTRELLIVNTSVLPKPYPGLVLSRESAVHVLSGVDGLAWLPTGPEVMQEILQWCGFPHARADLYWTPGKPRDWMRLQIIAARDEATFARYDLRRPEARLNQPVRARRNPVRRALGAAHRRLKALRAVS